MKTTIEQAAEQYAILNHFPRKPLGEAERLAFLAGAEYYEKELIQKIVDFTHKRKGIKETNDFEEGIKYAIQYL